MVNLVHITTYIINIKKCLVLYRFFCFISQPVLCIHGYRSESPGRKFLTKQYSIDLGMECPSSNQSNSRVTNLQFGGKHNTHQIKITTEDNIFHSHPTINHLTFNESDPGIASDKTLSTRNAKQCLLRTRSSGAKYNHYKDKYKLAKSTAKNTSRNLC